MIRKNIIYRGVLIFFLSQGNIYAQTTWETLPFTTSAQKEAGISGGEGGQVIFTMRVSPSNPNYIYMATDTSRVWASTNGGVSWENKPTGFVTKGAISLAIDPNNENVVLAAGSVSTVSHTSGPADGIYRTTDGGDNWSLVFQTDFIRDNGQDNFTFIDSNTVYCGTPSAGILKSSDNGATWSSLNHLTDRVIGQVVHSSDAPTKIFIGTTNGLYTLTNNVTLTEIGEGLPNKDITALALHPTNSNIMYVTVNGSVYKSTDSGHNFIAANTGLPTDKSLKNIEISPVNPNYLYTSTEGQLWLSHNAGSTWANITAVDAADYMHDIAQSGAKSTAWTAGSVIAPSYINARVAFASGAGHYPMKTSNAGETWSYSGSGFLGIRGAYTQTSFMWDKNNPSRYAIATTDHGIFITEDNGQTFRNTDVPRAFGSKTSRVGAFDPESNRIVGTTGNWSSQQIIVSVDNGNTWELKAGTDGALEHQFAAFHPQEPNNVYVGKFFSSNKGDTWTELPRIIYGMYQQNADIVYSVSINRSNALTIYKSTDKGVTWTTPYPAITNYARSTIRGIAIDPFDQDRIYVASEARGLFIWDGVNWLEQGEAKGITKDYFGDYAVQKIVIDPVDSNIVYIGKSSPAKGHSNGVFRSTDKGLSWQNITAQFGNNINITALGINPHNRHLYMGGSTGNYIYMSTNTADVDQSGSIDTTDALLTLRNSVGLSMSGTDWKDSTATGDVNCDDVSNSTDAMLILRDVRGLSMSETGWCVTSD